MGQIVGSSLKATAAMFVLWIGVMGVIATGPTFCENTWNLGTGQDGIGTVVKTTVLPG